MSQFKNFLDKAKKKAEQFAEEIAIKPTEKKLIEYNETFFSFKVEGGPKHTDMLVAAAKIKEGQYKDSYIPLVCKWFKSDASDQMKEIIGLTGPAYQPSIDDVGVRYDGIMQAQPTLNGHVYTGMPLFLEVGPLTLDLEIEKQALANLELETCEIPVKLEAATPKPEDLELPSKGIIMFNRIARKLTLISEPEGNERKTLATIDYSESYPAMELDKYSGTGAEISLSPEESYKVSIDDHKKRDSLTLTIRTCFKLDLSQQPIERKPSDELGAAPEKPKEEAVSAPTPSLESLIKIESLAKDLKKSQKENEKLKWDLETMNKNYEKMKIQLQESNDKLAQLEKLTNEESGQISKVLEEKEKYLSEKVYYLQEINLYKAQVAELESQVQAYKSKEQAGRRLSTEKQEIFLQYDEISKGFKTEIAKLELEIDQLKTERDKFKSDLDFTIREKEDMEGQVNSLKSKIKSLVLENEKLSGKGSIETPTRSARGDSFKDTLSPKSDEYGSPLLKHAKSYDPSIDADKIKAMEAEIKSLKDHNIRLSNTIEAYIAHNFSLILRIQKGKTVITGNKSSKPSSDTEMLQKLVNTLTETLTEKEIALEHQRSANKTLGIRITELEEEIKILLSHNNNQCQKQAKLFYIFICTLKTFQQQNPTQTIHESYSYQTISASLLRVVSYFQSQAIKKQARSHKQSGNPNLKFLRDIVQLYPRSNYPTYVSKKAGFLMSKTMYKKKLEVPEHLFSLYFIRSHTRLQSLDLNRLKMEDSCTHGLGYLLKCNSKNLKALKFNFMNFGSQTIEESHIIQDKIMKNFKVLKNLTHLSLILCVPDSRSIANLLISLRYIKRISLDFCAANFATRVKRSFKQALETLTNLEQVELKFFSLTEDEKEPHQGFFSFLCYLHELKQLSIIGGKPFQEITIDSLAKGLQDCNNIANFSYLVRESKEGLDKLIQALKGKHIQHLNLHISEYKMSNSFFHSLGEVSISDLKSLELDLNRCMIFDTGTECLQVFHPGLAQLTFKMSSCGAFLNSLIESFSQLINLKSFNFEVKGDIFSDIHLQKFVQCLEKMKLLEHLRLDISANKGITDLGMSKVADALKVLTNIRELELNMSGNSHTTQSMHNLFEAIGQNSHLISLKIDTTFCKFLLIDFVKNAQRLILKYQTKFIPPHRISILV